MHSIAELLQIMVDVDTSHLYQGGHRLLRYAVRRAHQKWARLGRYGFESMSCSLSNL
jgi:hypothetical protein